MGLVSARTEGVFLAILTAIMWGFLPILMKAGLLAFSGSLITAVRVIVSLAILVAYAKFNKERVTIRPFPRTALLGGVGLSANFLLYIYGVEATTAISAQIIVQITTILMVITGVLALHEKMSGAKAVGTILAVTGVLIIIWGGADLSELLGRSSSHGNLMIIAASVTWPAYGYSQVVLNRNVSPSHALMLILLPASAVTLVTFPTFRVSSFALSDLLVLVLLIMFLIIPYASLARSFKRIESSTAIVITTLSALFTPLGVYLLGLFDAPFVRGETITYFTGIGGTLVLVGIFVAVKIHDRNTSQPQEIARAGS